MCCCVVFCEIEDVESEKQELEHICNMLVLSFATVSKSKLQGPTTRNTITKLTRNEHHEIIMETTSDLETRIRTAKKIIRDATASAMKFAETDKSILTANDSFQPTATMNDDQQFDLAMTLFGDDTKAMEENIKSSLLQVESDLHSCLEKWEGQVREGSNEVEEEEPPKVHYESFGLDENADSSDKRYALEAEAVVLQSKITFLKKCSDARMALDEVHSLALEASTGAQKCVVFPSATKLSEAKTSLDDAISFLDSISNSSHEEDDGLAMRDRDLKVARDIIGSIHTQIRRKASDLHCMALSILDSYIQISSSQISICNDSVSESSHAEHIHEGIDAALNALALLSEGSDVSILENAIRNIAHRVMEEVLRPQIEKVKTSLESGKKPQLLKWNETKTKASSGHYSTKSTSLLTNKPKGIVNSLEWSLEDDSSSSIELWWPNILQFVQSVSKFLLEHFLSHRSDIVPVFGNIVFGKAFVSKNPYHVAFEENVDMGQHTPIVKLLCRIFWDHCIPSTCSVDDFLIVEKEGESLQKCNASFEAFMIDSGFISKSTILSEYGTRFKEKYSEKIRQIILARGRNILLEQDYHNTIEVGVDIYKKRKDNRPVYLDELKIEDNDMGVFFMDKACISQVASNLLQLVIETMDQAIECATTNRSLMSSSLYRAARELLDLFRAIIPAAHGKEIASIPRTAAVFHNDCVYFTNKLLTLGVEYRDKFPQDENGNDSALKVICTFLDAVPTFRELADKSMNEMIDFQKAQLSELISPRIKYIKEALGSNEGVIEWTEAETALTSGIYHCRHLSRVWKTVLSHDVYGRTIGSLVDTLYKLYLDQIIGAKEISEQATHFVSALFRDALKSTSEFFGSPKDVVEATKEASRYCSLHHKFTAIGKFMDMTLTDITMGLSDGTFQSVSSSELTALVLAAYTDSPRRRSLIQLLRAESNK